MFVIGGDIDDFGCEILLPYFVFAIDIPIYHIFLIMRIRRMSYAIVLPYFVFAIGIHIYHVIHVLKILITLNEKATVHGSICILPIRITYRVFFCV